MTPRQCTTHTLACDCKEVTIKELAQENTRMRAEITALKLRIKELEKKLENAWIG